MTKIENTSENTSHFPMLTPENVLRSSRWSGQPLPRRCKMAPQYMLQLLEHNSSAHTVFSHIIYRMRVQDKSSYIEAITVDVSEIRLLFINKTWFNNVITYLILNNLLHKITANKQDHRYYVNPSIYNVMNRQQSNDYCDAFDTDRLFGDISFDTPSPGI